MFFRRKNRSASPVVEKQPTADIPTDYGEALSKAVVRFYSPATLCFDKLRVEVGMGLDCPPLPPVKWMTESIACGLAIDIGPSYQRVNSSDLDGWGVSFDQMLEQVAQQRRSTGVEAVTLDGMAMVHDETGGPCLWVCPDLAEAIVGGRPVMVGQRRTCTILGREDDLKALEHMASFCRTALDGDEWVESVTPTRWTGSQWESMTWEELGVSHDASHAITALYDSANYGRVRPVLKQWYESRRECPIIPSFSTYSNAEQKMSMATSILAGDTRDYVIPKADRVAFTNSRGEIKVTVLWDVALEHCEMTPVGLSPEWYRVGSIPSYAELVCIGSVSEPDA